MKNDLRLAKPDRETETEPIGWSRRWYGLETFCVVLLFFVFAGGAAPSTNESHYLTRAKHFWNPAWCAGDIFLDSPESQPVFQFLFGWPTLWCQLATVSWLGRLVGWTLLALAWVRLVRIVVSGCGWAWIAAGLALVLWNTTAMAGEWVVGGIEAKVPAYAFLMWGLGSLALGQWQRAVVLMATATAFHPLVGGWGLVAGGIVCVQSLGSRNPTNKRPAEMDDDADRRSRRGAGSSRLSLAIALLVATALVIAGVLPALRLDRGADTETIRMARWVYVMARLDHHLLLTHFSLMPVVRHITLAIGWWMWWRIQAASDRVSPQMNRVQHFVLGCVLIAIAGFAIELVTIRNWEYTSGWMRYYWYRMTDSMLPIGVALLATNAIRSHWRNGRDAGSWALIAALLVISGGMIFLFAGRRNNPLPMAVQQADRLQPMGPEEFDDWRSLGHWFQSHSPTDSLCLTPTYQQTFKWYAHRAEYAIWKDVPQGSRAITAWWERRQAIRRYGLYFFDENGKSPVVDQGMLEWAKSEKIDFIVVRKQSTDTHWLARIVYENASYVVYSLE